MIRADLDDLFIIVGSLMPDRLLVVVVAVSSVQSLLCTFVLLALCTQRSVRVALGC